ncbi:L-threonylcarbamoyladenylate synthase [Thermogutta sp.]|jgi:protein-tyrosine phosphatase|uniref:L-threonylcarbamoyladenylate synthase n=1 Tax=Thermogutta sp. TaxID=1962930 RepID=UPI0032204E97
MTSPPIINIREAEEPRDLVHRCVQALAEGQIVVMPTETIYGVAASVLVPQAVERLAEMKGRKQGHAFTLALKSAEEIWDYVPDLPPVAWRLARRAWPGPLTLVVETRHRLSAARRFPPEVHQLVCPEGTLGFRVPDHFFISEVLRLLPAPLVLTSVNKTGKPPARSAEEAAASLPEVDLIFDDGPAAHGIASTVVKVENGGWTILREGVLSKAAIAEMASAVILFVCAGNTCRSPMAQALCQAMLAEKLHCSAQQLRDFGVVVRSAGLEAYGGDGASPQAIEVLKQRGINLEGHMSQQLTDSLVRDADRIYTMTRALKEAILARWPDAADRIDCLDPRGQDIADPFGGPLQAYEACAKLIEQALRDRCEELLRLVVAPRSEA